MSHVGIAAAIGLLAGLPAPSLGDVVPPRPSYGHLEHIKVVERTPVEVTSKLDPASEFTVLDAVNIKYFQRDGDTWVRFTVDNGSVLPGNRVTLERPVLKDVHVHQRGGGIEHQPRVEVELCLGVQDFKTEVRLVERKGYTPPLTLGRADLQRLGGVDAHRQFTQEPRCVPPQPPVDSLPAAPASTNTPGGDNRR